MKRLVSIRMRASGQPDIRGGTGADSPDIHISGAEGIYEQKEIFRIVRSYLQRAMTHPKGRADRVVLTVEDIREKPLRIKALPVTTLRISPKIKSGEVVRRLLTSLNISPRATESAFRVLRGQSMRGASIISAKSGRRLENDRLRGVRVSRLGISRAACRELSRRLAVFNINNDTVKEAIILASKVAASNYVIAEVCISDDPDYTTGYVASDGYGYLRIPNIKSKKSRSGGRVFFITEEQNPEEVAYYLERVPVIVDKISPCRGVSDPDEIISSTYK